MPMHRADPRGREFTPYMKRVPRRRHEPSSCRLARAYSHRAAAARLTLFARHSPIPCRRLLEDLVTRVCADHPSAPQKAIGRTRREVLRVVAATLPAAAGIALAGRADGFSREEMPAETARLYRDRCTADPLHAPTLDAAFARLDAVGVRYDREEVAASRRCPVCGCNIISVPSGVDRSRPAPSS
jgi:hypothetical protein